MAFRTIILTEPWRPLPCNLTSILKLSLLSHKSTSQTPTLSLKIISLSSIALTMNTQSLRMTGTKAPLKKLFSRPFQSLSSTQNIILLVFPIIISCFYSFLIPYMVLVSEGLHVMADLNAGIISEVSKTEGRFGQTTNVVIGGTVTDDATNEWLTLDQKVNSCPTVRGFTAIGIGGDYFVQAMVVAVELVLQQPIPEGQAKQKKSSGEKYVSVNIGPVQVASSEQQLKRAFGAGDEEIITDRVVTR